ncbi:PREDICTED: cytochrome P450 705A5-like isoform X2 [Camelina sativa]|uniref:Cytochrome P450 705A5-like isoform X2 n=1 Tax=Camelina sativa TaxID=90675 RepID=A0ABM0YZT6_CAMSA|nr:PREDICTED: cytochrome P450 705A5-like isoform X2 [Camelina sativa]
MDLSSISASSTSPLSSSPLPPWLTRYLRLRTRTSPLVVTEDSLFTGSSSVISSSYGHHWKFMKKLMVTKLLGAQALERSRDVRADELERFYTSLLDKAMKEEPVEIGKETMIMGRSCSEENGEAERLRALATKSLSLGKKIVLGSVFKKLGIILHWDPCLLISLF